MGESELGSLLTTICSDQAALRDQDFFTICAKLSATELLASLEEVEQFRRGEDNLYRRVRALMFLYSLCRFYLQDHPEIPGVGTIPYSGVTDLLSRRFEEAIGSFRRALKAQGPRGALFSALADAYHRLAFQTLVDLVRRSVRASRGNQWMFRVGHGADHPVRLRPELSRCDGRVFPILREVTPVRLDLSHSGWSDIFFLGMDYPAGARVINISVDLGVYGREESTAPPVETYLRILPEPVLRLTSVDLKATKDVASLGELFNFGNDYLSLLKAGVIAAGLIPPGFEGTNQPLADILARVIGPGRGLELVTRVSGIPKGSRLAVSTNLLASIIAAIMRATGQTRDLNGPLREMERRLVASRAILGEWLGGSGGGWQDSGGVWPGFKTITGVAATPEDPEYGISAGCLLPRHQLLGGADLHPEIKERLAASLVLIHGGMAQNVGPILEMVTEKYLLRSSREWQARQAMPAIFNRIQEALRVGDIRALATATMDNWTGPLPTIIPWVTNQFTETIIRRAREVAGDDFWGFQMLGGMSGGGMGMYVDPRRKQRFRDEILTIMGRTKDELAAALPFAMDPVVYNFHINEAGTMGRLLTAGEAVMPAAYHEFFAAEKTRAEAVGGSLAGGSQSTVDRIKEENGFDPILHGQIRADFQAGRIGLAHNRLAPHTRITDVEPTDLAFLAAAKGRAGVGDRALADGKVAVMTLAAGVGSRWTEGAGVVKALHPFVQIGGEHRSFLALHLAKTSQSIRRSGAPVPHIVSTSYLTHGAIQEQLTRQSNYGFTGALFLSPGRAVGQRLIPMVRDLVFLWEEMPQEILDEEKQKVRADLRKALLGWARSMGEGSDYTANLPHQCLHPPGHWYEIPNLFRNGTLARLLREQPMVETIMLHNVDTLGADLDPAALGVHLASGNALTFEVVPRQIEDRGGGLARVNDDCRLLEGLAQPREEDEFKLSYYNTMTTWIQIDPLLSIFGLNRSDLTGPPEKITAAVRRVGARLPTYVTIKDVKWRWGRGQEDVYPVAQVEKLWSDMTWLTDVSCGFLAVPRYRGRQLKDPSQLDAWANDGGKEHVARICGF